MKQRGGTSIADDKSHMFWLVAAIGIGVLLVVVFMVRGNKGGQEDGSAAKPVVEVDTNSTTRETKQPEPLFTEPGPGKPSPGSDTGRAEAMAGLEESLNARKLWATVERDVGDDAVVIVKTAYCEDAAFPGVVDKARARLKSQKFSRLACYETHGRLVTEQPL